MGIFSELPRHNQNFVLKKLDFKEFAKFKQSSKEAEEIAKNFCFPLPIKVEKIFFDDHYITVQINSSSNRLWSLDTFSEENLRFDAKRVQISSQQSAGVPLDVFCRKMILRAEELHVAWITVDPMTISNLIEPFKVALLNISFLTNFSDVHDFPKFRRLKEIQFNSSQLSESDFLLLEYPRIVIRRGTVVSLSAINKCLKQWLIGKRRIEDISIYDVNFVDHLEIFNGLEYVVHYSRQSPFDDGYSRRNSGDSLEDILELSNVYSLMRENDGKKLFISIGVVLWDSTLLRIGESDDDDYESWIRARYMSINGL